MKQRIFSVIAAVALALGLGVAVAPAASAGQGGNVTFFKHANFDTVLGSFPIGSADCDGAGYTKSFGGYPGDQITSIQVSLGTGMTHCNYISYMNFAGQWGGQCLARATSPFYNPMAVANVGPNWNDNVYKIRLLRIDLCYPLSF